MTYRHEVVDFNLFMKENEFDVDMVKQLYKVVLTELVQEKDNLVSNFENVNFEGFKKIIHKIKGVTSSYKILRVLEIINDLEVELKEEKYDNINIRFENLKESIDDAVFYINEYFSLNGGE